MNRMQESDDGLLVGPICETPGTFCFCSGKREAPATTLGGNSGQTLRRGHVAETKTTWGPSTPGSVQGKPGQRSLKAVK